MRLQTIIILILTLAGFALRLHYAISTHPFFDEYTTVLAARQILRHGWPILPSGLFYEHGLLATYLTVPFTALFINTPLPQWQAAHWGLMLPRWPSVLLSTATIPLIYAIGQRCFAPANPKPVLSGILSDCPSSLHADGQQTKGEAEGPKTCPEWHPERLPVQSTRGRAADEGRSRRVQNPKPVLSVVEGSEISLLAAGLFALSPEGIVWGGRARMYALATLLVLLSVYWAYRGATYPAPAKYRWWALLALLTTLLTHLGAIVLAPPLVVSMIVVGWLSWRKGAREQRTAKGAPKQHIYVSRFTFYASHPWFLRPTILVEGTALAAVLGLAIFVKRLGRPLGAAVLGDPSSSNFLAELLNTVTYQTAFYFTWPDTIKFLARQFGASHHFWLMLVTLIGGLTGLIFWLLDRLRNEKIEIKNKKRPVSNIQVGQHVARNGNFRQLSSTFSLFLWLVFGLIILQMVTLLEPFRRNPRYILMYLPLFYLIAANSISYLVSIIFKIGRSIGPRDKEIREDTPRAIGISLALLALFVAVGFNDLRVALLTPEPAYEQAFAHIQAEWQPGDTLLTMNTPAAGLYLGQVDGFTVQVNASQFLLDADAAPVDRWLGTPWLGQATDFNAALNAAERSWFVIDTIRQPVYFRGDWLAVLNGQMEQVWAKDNALIYRTRPDRQPLPTQPDIMTNATLGGAIKLAGYTLQLPDSRPQTSNSTAPASNLENQNTQSETHYSELKLTFFWQSLRPVSVDYTTFLHLRNRDGLTVAQRDGQPLDGTYPTSHWQPGETVIDPITLPLAKSLPAGSYTLAAGLYQLDTLERLAVANDPSGENVILLGEITLP